MAAVMTAPAPSDLGKRGRALAVVQVLQIGSGLIGQVLLLARWSPDAQTDLFLLLSGVPWLVSAAALVSGLEMAFPAAYHRALVASGEDEARRLLSQAGRLSLLVSFAAAGISGVVVAVGAAESGLSAGLSAWMGAAMGLQVIPAALGGLWRGALVARDDLIRARLTLLAGSLLTVAGYAVLPGPSALALPLIAACAMVLTALLARPHTANRVFQVPSPRVEKGFRGEVNQKRHSRFDLHRYTLITASLHPEIIPLIHALVGLSAAAGLVNLQVIIERTAVRPLPTGTVTALAVAGRGWDAVLAVIVAAGVMPVFPRWANYHAQGQTAPMRALLRWSLRRATVLTALAAVVIGITAWQIGPWLAHWAAGEQAAQMALVLLPRFVLVSCAQPLILKHYASGTPWYPVIGSAAGVGVLLTAVLIAVPRYGLSGFMLATVASAIPGWLVLVGYEWRNTP
jgi:peptidoglycan biosynthesis protein MviN/MurJ (putative lipid II flippase)